MNIKENILIYAQKLFNEKGYDYVSMREIASRLNISVGNLTYHFKKKEDIYRALLLKNKMLNSDIRVNCPADLNLMFSEMINSLVDNRYFFTNDKLYSMDNKFFDTNRRHVAIQKENLLMGISRLKELGYMEKSISEDSCEALISMIMYAHLEWCRELEGNACRPALSKEDFIKMHWNLMLPYMTQKGRDYIQNADFFKC